MRISQASPQNISTGILVLADGTVFKGMGQGAEQEAVGEVCFNTAITGYQEILTDPSYADQIITFTFPHIGNVGTNEEDNEFASENASRAAKGAIFKAEPTIPSNYRENMHLSDWLRRRGIVALCNIDTRALTALIREKGMQHGVIAHNRQGHFDIPSLVAKAQNWQGLEGKDLAPAVTTMQEFSHSETSWVWDEGYGDSKADLPHLVVMDFGVKANILRLLADRARVTVVPATASFAEITAHQPDGVVLSNGPGDPAATGDYVAPVIKEILAAELPCFGICLGHQMLALASGAKTKKMAQGHHGANHPVKDDLTGKVEIVSMNHGFTVDEATLPAHVSETHKSLFDGTNSGIQVTNAAGNVIAFSVQHHPEASPGPQDSYYIFDRFLEMVTEKMDMKQAS